MAAELTKYAIWLCSPLGMWIGLCVLAHIGVSRRNPLGRSPWRVRVLWLAHLQLFAFSLPWVSDSLFGYLEEEARLLQESRPLPAQVDAIVVLGGGVAGRFEGVRNLPDLNDSGDRVWEGARLYKQGVSKHMVLSGGGFEADPRQETEAPGMKIFMLEMGVPEEALLIEDGSRTTFENALRTREILRSTLNKPAAEPLDIALVTSAFHMGRSVLWFEQAGFTVYPVRSDIRVLPAQGPFWEQLPKPLSLDRSSAAIKELLGRLQLRVQGVYANGSKS